MDIGPGTHIVRGPSLVFHVPCSMHKMGGGGGYIPVSYCQMDQKREEGEGGATFKKQKMDCTENEANCR